VAEARHRFRDAGLSPTGAELDARLLAQFVLGWTAERLLTSGSEPAPPEFAQRYGGLIERRLQREPLAYIVGQREFWGLTFEVSPAVLIPRPETELIVEAALELFPEKEGPLNTADICTGSGCVAIALAVERPAARIVAADISTGALQIAARNARRHGIGDRLRFHHADMFEGVAGPFDLITCNPPYVAEKDRTGLTPEVRDYEPGVALFGGRDGLALVERLVASAACRLRQGGHLLFEFGCGQDEHVESILSRSAGLRLVALRRDLQGIARTAVVERV
jgi:release factor glutamine methyltransferase